MHAGPIENCVNGVEMSDSEHSRSWSADFGPFDGHIWLNAAHQGAMPKAAAEATLSVIRQNNTLVDLTSNGLDPKRWEVLVPQDPHRRSSLLFVRPRQEKPDKVHRALEEKHIHVGLREGLLRLAPHIYNTPDEIERTVSAMNQL